MGDDNCPGYEGRWFGKWGTCRHLIVYGAGWLLESGSLEYLCRRKLWGVNDVVACPTKGRWPAEKS